MDADAAGRTLVEQRLAQAEFATAVQQARGEWIDVPANLLLFHEAAGQWSVQGDALVGTFGDASGPSMAKLPNGHPVLLFEPPIFGNYELQVTIATEADISAGLFPLLTHRFGGGTLYNQHDGEARVVRNDFDVRQESDALQAAGPWPLVVYGELRDDRSAVWLDGESEPNFIRCRPETVTGPGHFALAASDGETGDRVTFSNVRLRLLDGDD